MTIHYVDHFQQKITKIGYRIFVDTERLPTSPAQARRQTQDVSG
jgi:hypothetical protein